MAGRAIKQDVAGLMDAALPGSKSACERTQGFHAAIAQELAAQATEYPYPSGAFVGNACMHACCVDSVTKPREVAPSIERSAMTRKGRCQHSSALRSLRLQLQDMHDLRKRTP